VCNGAEGPAPRPPHRLKSRASQMFFQTSRSAEARRREARCQIRNQKLSENCGADTRRAQEKANERRRGSLYDRSHGTGEERKSFWNTPYRVADSPAGLENSEGFIDGHSY